MHALGRACLALRDPDCAPLLGPPVPGATLPLGARVPGTSLELEPASAAFNLGAMIHGECACAADHVAALLAAADYAARHAYYDGISPPTVADLLAGLRQAEAFERTLAADAGCRGDPALCRRAADAFVATALLGGSPAQQVLAARRASLDGSPATAGHSASGGDEDHAAARRRRRAAGENAARALRHALAVLQESTSLGGVHELLDEGAGQGSGVVLAAVAVAVAARVETAAAAPSLQETCLGSAFEAAVAALYPRAQAAAIVALFQPGSGLEALAVDAFVARLVRN